MKYNKLLQEQIKQHLTPEFFQNKEFNLFLEAINDSYLSFEKDKDLINHAFQEYEKEYYEVNESLKKT